MAGSVGNAYGVAWRLQQRSENNQRRGGGRHGVIGTTAKAANIVALGGA